MGIEDEHSSRESIEIDRFLVGRDDDCVLAANCLFRLQLGLNSLPVGVFAGWSDFCYVALCQEISARNTRKHLSNLKVWDLRMPPRLSRQYDGAY